FVNCDFTKVLTFDGLKNLTQLNSLHFDQCYGITTLFLQPLLDITTPLKIKSLKVVGHFPVLDLLLEKIGSYLEYLELFLNDGYFLNELITHFSKSLRYLSFKNDSLDPNDSRNIIRIDSMILKVLGQILPDSLEYLNLDFAFQPNDLK
ncbi:5070_t:CDS:2, partial [Funneliformis geosporum]